MAKANKIMENEVKKFISNPLKDRNKIIPEHIRTMAIDMEP